MGRGSGQGDQSLLNSRHQPVSLLSFKRRLDYAEMSSMASTMTSPSAFAGPGANGSAWQLLTKGASQPEVSASLAGPCNAPSIIDFVPTSSFNAK